MTPITRRSILILGIWLSVPIICYIALSSQTWQKKNANPPVNLERAPQKEEIPPSHFERIFGKKTLSQFYEKRMNASRELWGSFFKQYGRTLILKDIQFNNSFHHSTFDHLCTYLYK